jgi:UDP-N-acetylmuramate dehydrogenase
MIKTSKGCRKKRNKMQDLESEISKYLDVDIKFDEPMSNHTSLKIGGPVNTMVFPADPVSLKRILAAADSENIPVFFFGAGTNLLVGDGRFEGIAISLKNFHDIELTRDVDENKVVLYVGSGVPLPKLMSVAKKNGYSGLEPLTGIPGCVGGAVYMNAGSFGTEMRDLIVSVALMNIKGEITIVNADELSFTYRSSGIPDDSVILSANIRLAKDDSAEVGKRMKEYMKRKKAAQPLGEFSAGCVFKNPEKDSAGRLIDAAGCKGMKVGDIEVSTLHANYFINKGKGTCKDFVSLMDKVRAKVKKQSGVKLEPEVRIIGER